LAIPTPPPGTYAENGSGRLAQPTSHTPNSPPVAPDAAPKAEMPAITYVEFAAAVKDALRDVHSPDLLARNPLLRDGLWNFGESAGPQELRALLCETVHTLFDNARDEKLCRILELTYSEPFLKQEAVADRLALSFGTYRRHLGYARDRMTRWLWETSRLAQIQSALPLAAGPTASGASAEGETATARANGEPALPRLSVVVLPFLNVGGSAEDDAFVDGITETLTTDLSRCSDVFAISRNTAFAYKGKRIDTRQIGRELGVRYVLEGSVQNTGERIRFNAQLVDAESGGHLWAERFDKQRADLLDMQDEVTPRLARSIHMELIAAESRRAAHEPVDRLDAVDHALRGWAAWNQRRSRETARQARTSFKAALRLDGSNISALLGLADAHIWEVNCFISHDRPGQIRAAEAAVKKALELAPRSAAAHLGYGRVLLAMRRPERALREVELANLLDRNLAAAHGYLGQIKIALGRAGETRAHAEEAIRLSPQDQLLRLWHYLIGLADVYLGRVVSGIESLRKSVEIDPGWGFAQFTLAAALALAGLLAEAAEVCAVARRLAPNFTIAKFRAEAVSDNQIYLAQRENLYEGLRLAGVPES
jgi:TolB-like protein/tetratricopeptide (TPR) repeat protein